MWVKISRNLLILKDNPHLQRSFAGTIIVLRLSIYQMPVRMEERTAVVFFDEFKKLLNSIAGNQDQIGLRFRSIDQFWHPNFLQIVKITDGAGVLFMDKTRNKLISLFDLSTVIQFELDGHMPPFEPNFQYEISHS